MIKLYIGDRFLCMEKFKKYIKDKTMFNYRELSDPDEGKLLFLAPIFGQERYFILEYPVYGKMVERGFPFGSLPNTTNLFIYAESVDKRKKIWKSIKIFDIKIEEIPELTENLAFTWLRKLAAISKTQIETGAIRLLLQYLGLDAKSLHSEFSKLSKLTNKMITAKSVQLYTRVERTFQLYEVSNLLILKKYNEAISMFLYMQQTSDSFLLIRYLQNFYMNLIIVKINSEVLKDRYKDYTINKFKEIASKFSLETLYRCDFYCFDAEVQVKSNVDINIIIKNLFFKLVRK